MNIQDLNGGDTACGVQIIPGLARKAYAVCSCDIDVFPARLAFNPASPGDSITLDGDIVLNALKEFAELEMITDSGKVMHKQVGAKGFENYNNEFSFKAKKTIGADEWFNNTRNACLVIIVTEKDGTLRVIGSKDVPASMSASEGTTGDGSETEKVWNCTVMDTTGYVAPVYTGAIDIDPLT